MKSMIKKNRQGNNPYNPNALWILHIHAGNRIVDNKY